MSKRKSLLKMRRPGVLVIALLSITSAVVYGQSALTYYKFEAESGTLSNQAESSSDANASGGRYVNFFDQAPPVKAGTFSETFNSNLDNWTFGHWAYEISGLAKPGSSATILNGRGLIINADQNYGEATLRSNRLYDITNGGTFAFDVVLYDGNLPSTAAKIGNPYVVFADQPLNASSYLINNNGAGTGPRNGGMYEFWHTCAITHQAGNARQFNNYVETFLPGADTSCPRVINQAPDQTNRVEMRYDGNNNWELWVSDAGTTAPLVKIRSYTMQIPEIGYFSIGSNNYASLKYSNNTRATANATFDNISYPAAAKISDSYRDGANVVKGTASKAHIVFNGFAPSVDATFSVTVNGTTVPFTPYFQTSRSFPASVEVPLSLIHDGNNTISVSGLINVANIDIVLTRDIN